MKADLSSLLAKKTHYGTVVIDYPWPERGGTNGKAGWSESVAANFHYDTMTLLEVMATGPDVSRLALPDAHLYLWATNLQLATGVAADVVRACGFRPLTVITWHKTTGEGIGQRFVGKTEHCVVGVRGKTPYPKRKDGKKARGDTWFDTTVPLEHFDAPRGSRHSAKPTQIHEWAEAVSPGPRLELFAREARPGWTAWGNEAPKRRRAS